MLNKGLLVKGRSGHTETWAMHGGCQAFAKKDLPVLGAGEGEGVWRNSSVTGLQASPGWLTPSDYLLRFSVTLELEKSTFSSHRPEEVAKFTF